MHDPKEPTIFKLPNEFCIIWKEILFERNDKLIRDAYIGADYVGFLVDRKSTFGYCTFLGGNLVTWKSKNQNVDARSYW
jgi:hypothetical protein